MTWEEYVASEILKNIEVRRIGAVKGVTDKVSEMMTLHSSIAKKMLKDKKG